MKLKDYGFFGAAILIALITTALIMGYMKTKAGQAKVVRPETRPVAVASVDIPWGTVLSKERLKQVDFLKASAPASCFPDANSLIGRVVIYPIKADEPITESRLAPQDVKAGGVPAIVNPKKRAVAIKVDKVVGVSGFIHQGNYVDVLVTVTSAKAASSDQSRVTKTVLENVLVLTVGPDLEKKGKDEKAADVDVITVEVTPEEAEKLALASTEGKLQLTLRNFSDRQEVLTPGSTVQSLLASYRPEARGSGDAHESRPASNGKAADEPKSITVELIRGGKLTEMKF